MKDTYMCKIIEIQRGTCKTVYNPSEDTDFLPLCLGLV